MTIRPANAHKIEAPVALNGRGLSRSSSGALGTENAPRTRESTLKIRAAAPADAPAIARIHVETWRSAYRNIIPAAYLSALEVEPRVRRWEEILQKVRHFALVVEEAGLIVGWISFGPCRDEGDGHEAEIYAIYVDSVYQRGGRGSALLVAAEAQLTTSISPAATRLSVWALARNDAARRFYERHGYFSGPREKQELIGGKPYTEIRFEKFVGNGASLLDGMTRSSAKVAQEGL
jgi:ribosomal protein S18 acetylase RimI-like enzyme